MSGINSFSDYSSKYNSNIDYSALRSMLFSSDSQETVSYDQCLAITHFLTK